VLAAETEFVRISPLLFRVSAALLFAGATGPAQNPRPEPTREEPLVRVTVDLVQVDVIVTDRNGNHLSDLESADFEVLENGKPQRITNFSFIAGQAPRAPAAPHSTVGQHVVALPPIAPARLAPGQANRTIAVVVDDLGIGEESFASVHRALERFVEEQVQPGDLVALITTSGKLGALEQLTADKRLMRVAVAKFRSIPNHRPGVQDSDFSCVWFNHRLGAPTSGIQDEDGYLGRSLCGSDPHMDPCQELINDHRSEYYGRLSISALRRVVDGLRELPGRKSILLFSEGVPLMRGQGTGDVNEILKQAYNAFLTHANRSAVAVNTIDPRGLLALSSADWGDACAQARQTELVNTQQELAEIAHSTGGISIKDDNDLSGAMGRVMNDQAGYYLIGYKPSVSTAKGTRGEPRSRKIAVRVTRPGLTARFHSSLYEEEQAQPTPGSGNQRLVAAVSSPFAIPNVRVRISTRFWNAGAPAGSILDTVLQVDARDLAFSTESDGRRKAVFDILAVIYGGESKPLDTFDKSYTVSLTPDGYQKALADGLLQRLELAVKKAGAYQIRGAVRDRQADRIGSASDFVEVPDLSHGGLSLSGIALSASPGGASLVRYHAGQRIFCACQVLNAQPGADSSTHVEVQATLFRDQQALGSSKPMVVDGKDQPDGQRLLVADDFRLGSQLHSGDFTLRVTAVDKNSPPKRGTATQSIDFEVTEVK